MKKAIAILLALVMTLSLCACRSKDSETVSKDDLEASLKSITKGLSLQQSGNSKNDFYYSNETITETSDYVVKTNNKGYVQYLEITFQNIDTSLLSSTDSILKLMDLITNHPNDSKLKDTRAGICIAQIINLITLFDESYNEKTAGVLLNAVADVFSNGSSQFGNWSLSTTMNASDNTVIIIANPAE